jgi:hypothetical protein
MNTQINRTSIVIIFFYLIHLNAIAQKSLREYVEKAGKSNIYDKTELTLVPVTAAGFGDGHGRVALLTSADQIPDTIALATFYIYDLGSASTSTAGNWSTTTYTAVSEKGGNILANLALENSMNKMKAVALENGRMLLGVEEYLNTPEKKDFYYNGFSPQLSKLGKFTSNLENKHVDIAVGADSYRCLDVASHYDHLRSTSIGYELAGKLGVDGMLSVALEVQSHKKGINIHGIKVSLHGPNRIPKEDKKYVAQNLGNGYYEGQLYCFAYYFLKEPVPIAVIEKNKVTEMNLDGVGDILEEMIKKMEAGMKESVAKAASKYNK